MWHLARPQSVLTSKATSSATLIRPQSARQSDEKSNSAATPPSSLIWCSRHLGTVPNSTTESALSAFIARAPKWMRELPSRDEFDGSAGRAALLGSHTLAPIAESAAEAIHDLGGPAVFHVRIPVRRLPALAARVASGRDKVRCRLGYPTLRRTKLSPLPSAPSASRPSP